MIMAKTDLGKQLKDIHPIREEIVCPACGRSETRWLFGAAVLIFAVCASVVGIRTSTDTTKQIETWQIDAFNVLRPAELGTFNALRTAALEIEDVHDTEGERWMPITELQEYLVPPFVHDAAWRKSGKLTWEQNIVPAGNRHIALYRGQPQEAGVSGTFLLVMLHEHTKKQGNVPTGNKDIEWAENEFLKPTALGEKPGGQSDDKAVFPSSSMRFEHSHDRHAAFEIWMHRSETKPFPDVVTDQALIAAGWQEVIALSGKDEVRRVKGDQQS